MCSSLWRQAALVWIFAGIFWPSRSNAQSEADSSGRGRVWLAASVTPTGGIFGAGLELASWRFGAEILSSSPNALFAGQLYERIMSLGVSFSPAIMPGLYAKAALGTGRRWTEVDRTGSAPFALAGFGLVLPPKRTFGVRVSVDGIFGPSPAGQYPYSLHVGLGLILRLGELRRGE